MKDQRSGKPASRTQKGNARPAKNVGLGRDVQAKIGQHLRTMYDEVVKQGVPDHFADLLKQLDQPADKERANDA